MTARSAPPLAAPARCGRARLFLRCAQAAVVLALAWPGGRAAAQTQADLDRAKQSFQAGATAYAAGEYLAAIQAFDAAYTLTPLPAITFSLAQGERRQYFVDHDRAHLDRAIDLFRRYLGEVTSGGRRADALDALAQLEPLAAIQSGARAAGAPSGKEGGAPARQTRLMITCDAPGARLSLDGTPPAASPVIREVDPGAHRVAIAADGFFPAQRELIALEGELIPLAVTLRERPSTVVVTMPASADLYVDGAFVSGRRGEATLELPSGEHRLAAAQNGHRLSLRDLSIKPGEDQRVGFMLEPTRQRRVSQALLAGGGVALGAGVVLTVLAIHAQGEAQDFLGRQATGNVTSAELAGYAGDVTRRDRYRLAATVSLVAAAGATITALVLRALDRPDAQELSRSARPVERDRAVTSPTAAYRRLRLAPLAVGDIRGATLATTF